MLIILLLAVSFLTQVAVLAAPIPFNDVSLKARSPSFSDDGLFSRAPVRPKKKVPSMLAWVIFDRTSVSFKTFQFEWILKVNR